MLGPGCKESSCIAIQVMGFLMESLGSGGSRAGSSAALSSQPFLSLSVEVHPIFVFIYFSKLWTSQMLVGVFFPHCLVCFTTEMNK